MKPHCNQMNCVSNRVEYKENTCELWYVVLLRGNEACVTVLIDQTLIGMTNKN